MRSRAWLIAMVLFPIALGAFGTESTRPNGKPQSLPASINKADVFAVFVRAFDWRLADVSPDMTTCGELLGAIRQPTLLKKINPDVESDNVDDKGFQPFKQCRAVREKFARADIADWPEDFASLAYLGDHGFQLYSINPTEVTARSSDRTWKVLYAEFSPEKLGGNANMDGYSVVEFANCRVVGSVPIQRPDPKDLPVTPRDFMHGLYSVRGHTWLLVATEEVGKRYDPSAYRAITAYRLKTSGELIPACSWHPSEIVK